MEYFSRSNGSANQVFPRPQSELARCLEDNELPEFLEVLGAAQEVGYNLDEHYGKEVANIVLEFFETLLLEDPMQVGYKTILHLAIDEDDFNATPFVEACLKVKRTSSLSSPRISGAHIFILICPITLGPI